MEPKPLGDAYVIDPDAEVRIRLASTEFVEQAFQALRRLHVIPRSRHRPWVHIASDYFGDDVRDHGELAAELKRALPERFADALTTPDHPWSYGYAVLEAAIAAATMADQPYDLSSPAVQDVFDDFLRKLRRAPQSSVVQLVSDIDVARSLDPPRDARTSHQSIEIRGVRITAVGNDGERFVEREIPSAGYDVPRENAFAYPGPTSLLVSTEASISSIEARVERVRARLTSVLTAIRLATAATAAVMTDIEGDPDRVRWIRPSVRPLASLGMRWMHRSTVLDSRHVGGIGDLADTVQGWRSTPGSEPIRIALARFVRSIDSRAAFEDQAIDLSIGLEAALGGRDTTEVALRLRNRAAGIIATEGDRAEEIYSDVKALYEIRSRVVHGSMISEKAAKQAITRVARSPHRSPVEQYLLALDRWRDLLRRSILARAALASAPMPWKLSTSQKEFDVDGFLLAASNRERWSEHIHNYWHERGAATWLQPAAPPTFMLERNAPPPFADDTP